MSFERNNTLTIAKLAKAYRAGDLCLFIGAGLSKGCGLPLWDELVAELFDETQRRNAFFNEPLYGSYDDPKGWGTLHVANAKKQKTQLATFPTTIKGRYCKTKLGDEFKVALRRVLSASYTGTSQTVDTIAQMRGLSAICNFNYDDLIEQADTSAAFMPVFSGAPSPNLFNRIPIYHPHGFIALDRDGRASDDFVFSEEDYHRLYADASHWANRIQGELLSAKTSLFVGVSFTDPNIRRLVDAANAAKPTTIVGIFRVPMTRPERDHLYEFSSTLTLHEDVHANLGVSCLWVDEFEEIPIIFRSIMAGAGWPAKAQYIQGLNDWRSTNRPAAEKRRPCDCGQDSVLDSAFCAEHLADLWKPPTRPPRTSKRTTWVRHAAARQAGKVSTATLPLRFRTRLGIPI
jgi:SIR2-like domain